MKIKTVLLACTALLPASLPASAQQAPDDTCMDVTYVEGGTAWDYINERTVRRTQSGYMFSYNKEKSESAACQALRERAAAEFSTRYPPRNFDPEIAAAYNGALANLVDVGSTHETFTRDYQAAVTEAERLDGMYRPLEALHARGDYSTYLAELPAYEAALAGYPAMSERHAQAKSQAQATYDEYHRRFGGLYPSGYDWSTGGDQGLW